MLLDVPIQLVSMDILSNWSGLKLLGSFPYFLVTQVWTGIWPKLDSPMHDLFFFFFFSMIFSKYKKSSFVELLFVQSFLLKYLSVADRIHNRVPNIFNSCCVITGIYFKEMGRIERSGFSTSRL